MTDIERATAERREKIAAIDGFAAAALHGLLANEKASAAAMADPGARTAVADRAWGLAKLMFEKRRDLKTEAW